MSAYRLGSINGIVIVVTTCLLMGTGGEVEAKVQLGLTPEVGLGWSTDTYTADDTTPAGRFGAVAFLNILPELPMTVWFADTFSERRYLSRLSPGDGGNVDEHRLDLGISFGYDVFSLVKSLRGKASLVPSAGFAALLFNNALYGSYVLGPVFGGALGLRLADRLEARIWVRYLLGASKQDNPASIHGAPKGALSYQAALDLSFSERFALTLAYEGQTVAREFTYRQYHALLFGLRIGLILDNTAPSKQGRTKLGPTARSK